MRDYSRFYTLPETADRMVQLVRPIYKSMTILEPHAGNGRIVDAIRRFDGDVYIEANEIDGSCLGSLLDSGANYVTIGDFLEFPERYRYDRIIANPPFGNGIDIKAHFDKMVRLLHPMGHSKLISIVPEDFYPEVEYESEPLENWGKNKDGTVTRIKIVTVHKE